MVANCVTQNGHCMIFPPSVEDPAPYIAAQWQFLKDHPFGTTVDPYENGLPTSFPSVCQEVVAGGAP
jgi:hypothetical protein